MELRYFDPHLVDVQARSILHSTVALRASSFSLARLGCGMLDTG